MRATEISCVVQRSRFVDATKVLVMEYWTRVANSNSEYWLSPTVPVAAEDFVIGPDPITKSSPRANRKAEAVIRILQRE